MANKHYDVLIIGGGTAGIMTAAQLRRKKKDLKYRHHRSHQGPLVPAGLDAWWQRTHTT
jgi:flavin-dependent dehydrogenase